MSESDLTPRHPIRVVAQSTGLTPAALRAWERRYHAVQPSRSAAGQRLYSDRDVERLRRLRELTEHGRPISTVASLSLEDAEALLLEDRSNFVTPPHEPSVEQVGPQGVREAAFDLLTAYDGAGLERLLWHAAVTLGAQALIDDVVVPLLTRIGDGWVAGTVNPAQEHLGSAVLVSVLDRLAGGARGTDGPTLVVATLPGERHGLGARLAATTAALEGWKVTYLGTDLPVDHIASTTEIVGARAVAISVVKREAVSDAVISLSELRKLLNPHIEILIGGAGAGLIPPETIPRGITVLEGVEGLRTYLRDTDGSRVTS